MTIVVWIKLTGQPRVNARRRRRMGIRRVKKTISECGCRSAGIALPVRLGRPGILRGGRTRLQELCAGMRFLFLHPRFADEISRCQQRWRLPTSMTRQSHSTMAKPTGLTIVSTASWQTVTGCQWATLLDHYAFALAFCCKAEDSDILCCHWSSGRPLTSKSNLASHLSWLCHDDYLCHSE